MFANKNFSIKVNPEKIKWLLDNKDDLTINDSKTLFKILKKVRRKDNTLTAKYSPSRNLPKGRLYLQPFHIWSLEKRVRNTILDDYVDVDIQNCFVNILIRFCRRTGIQCDKLIDYAENRDKYAGECKNVKSVVCSMICDSEFKAYKELANKPDWLSLLKIQFEIIQEKIVELNDELLNKIPKKEYNREGKAVSHFLQQEENDVLMDTLYYMENTLQIPIDNALLMFDGFMLPRDKINQHHLTSINKHFNNDITYIFKPMEKIEIDEDDLSASTEVDAEYLQWKEEFEKKCFFVEDTLKYYINIRNGVLREASKGAIGDFFPAQGDYINRWYNDETKKTYAGIGTFPPPMKCEERFYNMWGGFEIETTKSISNRETIRTLEMFNELTYILSGKVGAYQKYLISWIADMFQNAGKKNNIALALYGEEGCGKGTLEQTLAGMLGDLYIPIADVTTLFNHFNEILKGKIFAAVDEVEKLGTVSCAEKLKTFITNPKMVVRGKGDKEYTDNNHIRLMLMTNNEKFLKVSTKDRRFVAFEASSDRLNDNVFFTEYYGLIAKKTNLKAIYDYLMSYDLSGLNWIKDRPVTNIMISNQMDCLPTEIKFIKYILLEASWSGDEYTLDTHRLSTINKELFDGVVRDRSITEKLKKVKECYTFKRTSSQRMKIFNRKTLYEYLDGKGYLSAVEKSDNEFHCEPKFVDEGEVAN